MYYSPGGTRQQFVLEEAEAYSQPLSGFGVTPEAYAASPYMQQQLQRLRETERPVPQARLVEGWKDPRMEELERQGKFRMFARTKEQAAAGWAKQKQDKEMRAVEKSAKAMREEERSPWAEGLLAERLRAARAHAEPFNQTPRAAQRVTAPAPLVQVSSAAQEARLRYLVSPPGRFSAPWAPDPR